MTQSSKKARIGISGFIALVSCPCHLPVTLPIILSITAGTSLGLWIINNTGVVAIISSLIFVGSLFLTFRLVNKREDVCSTMAKIQRQDILKQNKVKDLRRASFK